MILLTATASAPSVAATAALWSTTWPYTAAGSKPWSRSAALPMNRYHTPPPICRGTAASIRTLRSLWCATWKNQRWSYAENLSAPMLILHGMDDLRCPVEHAHQFFTALRDLHPEIPVKMILYPGCPHDQPRSISHKIHYYNAILDWFTRYLKKEQCQ